MGITGLNIFSAKNKLVETLLIKIKKGKIKSNIVELNYIRFRNKTERMETRKKLKERVEELSKASPFFGNKILVIINLTVIENSDLEFLMNKLPSNEKLLLIFINYNRDNYEKIRSKKIEGIGNINLYNPSLNLLQEHVKINTTKEFTLDSLDSLKKLMSRQWKYLEDYLNIINSLEEKVITANIIKQIIPKAEPLDFNTLMLTIMTGQELDKSLKSINNFRFANKFLLKEIKTKFKELIKYKKDWINGELSLENLEEYSKENNVMTYHLEFYITNIFNVCSLELMYKIYHTIIMKESEVINIILISNQFFNGGI